MMEVEGFRKVDSIPKKRHRPGKWLPFLESFEDGEIREANCGSRNEASYLCNILRHALQTHPNTLIGFKVMIRGTSVYVQKGKEEGK